MLTVYHSNSLATSHSLTRICTHLPRCAHSAPALQFKRALSLGRSFLLHMQLKARVSASPWRTFRCLPAHCCLAVHDNFSHSLAFSSSLPQHSPPLLSLHCTKALTTLVCICFDIALHFLHSIQATAAPPLTHLTHFPASIHLQHGRLGD